MAKEIIQQAPESLKKTLYLSYADSGRWGSFVFRYRRFQKLLMPFFFFIADSFNVMRLSIGSVVVVLVAEKRSCLGVQVFCGKYYSTKEDGDFLWNRRLELAHPQNTDLPLPPRNSNTRRKGQILNKYNGERRTFIWVIGEINNLFHKRAFRHFLKS